MRRSRSIARAGAAGLLALTFLGIGLTEAPEASALACPPRSTLCSQAGLTLSAELLGTGTGLGTVTAGTTATTATATAGTASAATGVGGISFGTVAGGALSAAAAAVGITGWRAGWLDIDDAGTTGLSTATPDPGWVTGPTFSFSGWSWKGLAYYAGGKTQVEIVSAPAYGTPAYGSANRSITIKYTIDGICDDSTGLNKLTAFPVPAINGVWLRGGTYPLRGSKADPVNWRGRCTGNTITATGQAGGAIPSTAIFSHLEVSLGSRASSAETVGVISPEIEWVKYVDAWFPEGHPQRPADVEPGTGTVTRRLLCLRPNGTTLEIVQPAPVNVTLPGQVVLDPLECPEGTVVAEFGATWDPADASAPTQELIPTTQTEPWVRQIPTQYPDCLTQTCWLELYSLTGGTPQTCGNAAIECPDWYIEPDRNTAYECHWGPYTVDLHYCSVFRDPGNLLPNAELDDLGNINQLQWPPLDLDTDVVARAAVRVQARYGDDACAVLGEAARIYASRAPVIETVLVCQEADILTAVQFISLADFVGLDGAVRALAEAADAPAPARLDPDCNLIDSTGACADPAQRTVSVGSTTWVTGPKSWASPSNQTVATVHDTCIEMVKAATPSLSTTQATEKCESQPIFVPGGKIGFGREAAEHDLSVITANPELVELEYISNPNKLLTGVRRGWYLSSGSYLAPCTGKISIGVTDCDEYPYYSAVEGGPAAYSAYGQDILKPINFKDNQREGIALLQMYRDAECAMTSAAHTSQPPGATGGTNYLVVPVPTIDVPSFYLCPSGD